MLITLIKHYVCNMFAKEMLLQIVHKILEKNGFEVSKKCDIRSCFDILARREALLLIIKTLVNVDAFSEEHAKELRFLASFLNASPLLVGIRAKGYYLEDGVVYERYSIPTVNPETLDEATSGRYPLVQAYRGGYYVEIDGDVLRKIREERGISLGDIAEKIGVSRRIVLMYEKNETKATLETAVRLEKFLNVPVAKPIDIFKVPEKVEIDRRNLEGIYSRLNSIGFEVYPTKKAPFSAVVKEDRKSKENIMITKLINRKIEKREVSVIKSISKISLSQAFFVSYRKSFRECINGIPVVKKDELEKIESSDELREVVSKRIK